MFDDKMDNLFSQFDGHEKRIRQKIRAVNSIYIERAMNIHKEDMCIFVAKLIEGTGVVLPSENEHES